MALLSKVNMKMVLLRYLSTTDKWVTPDEIGAALGIEKKATYVYLDEIRRHALCETRPGGGTHAQALFRGTLMPRPECQATLAAKMPLPYKPK